MKLETWRARENLSVIQLAELLGIDGQNPYRTVQRYLTDERIPDRGMMRKIAEITSGNVTGDDFPERAVRRLPTSSSAEAA